MNRFLLRLLILSTPLVLITCASAENAQPQVVYIVRHAEKAGDTGDVSLSKQGTKRAAALAKLLTHANIKAIYTSDAKRTKQTAAPLAEQLSLDLTEIVGGNPNITFDRILADHTKEAVLVVGHSDKIGPLIKKWNSAAEVVIAADEFDSIFVVVPNSTETGWTRFKYAVD
jgi:broad specificity phosphatase PhoE